MQNFTKRETYSSAVSELVIYVNQNVVGTSAIAFDVLHVHQHHYAMYVSVDFCHYDIITLV